MVVEAFLLHGLLSDHIAGCEKNLSGCYQQRHWLSALCASQILDALVWVRLEVRKDGVGATTTVPQYIAVGRWCGKGACRTAVVRLCVSRGALLSFAWYLQFPVSHDSVPSRLPLTRTYQRNMLTTRNIVG